MVNILLRELAKGWKEPGGYCENCYGGKFLYASPVSGDSH